MYRALLTIGKYTGGYSMAVAASSALSGIVGFPFAVILSLAIDLPLFPIVIYAAISTAITWIVHAAAMNVLGIPLHKRMVRINAVVKVAYGEIMLTEAPMPEYREVSTLLFDLPLLNAKIAFLMVLFIVIFSISLGAFSGGYSNVHLYHLVAMAVIITVLHTSYTYVFSEILISPALARVRAAAKIDELEYQKTHSLQSIKVKQIILLLLFVITLYVLAVTVYYKRGDLLSILGYATFMVLSISLALYLITQRIRMSLREIEEAAANLKAGSHAIISSGSFDKEFIRVAEGLNSATTTIFEYQNTLEQKVETRTQELLFEKQKSDRLLKNILPEDVIDELKTSGRVSPKYYQSASVLFTDFVGFTQIAEKLSPELLIAELDLCFSHFDQVIRKNHLEKLKTIGDSYMRVAGAPKASQTHAIDAALAALEIQAFMKRMKEEKAKAGLPYWELRLGIHCGPIVAGVIGEMKFAYDIWGDTVNTASRMESTGVPGKINISEQVFAELDELFDCEFRGSVAAKNKGEIRMYFVTGIKPQFAADAACLAPNAEFQRKYKRV